MRSNFVLRMHEMCVATKPKQTKNCPLDHMDARNLPRFICFICADLKTKKLIKTKTKNVFQRKIFFILPVRSK